MPNFRAAWDNLYRASTTVLTASSEAAALPVEASQNTDRSYVFRSGSVAVAVTIDIDLGSAQAVTSVFVANPRLFTGGGLELYERGSAGSPGAATLVATLSTADTYTKVAYAFFASQTKRHWQLKFTNPTPVTSYVEAGYVHLGPYSEPVQNIALPFPWRRVDPSVQVLSVDGQKTATQRTQYLVGEWTIRPALEADRTLLIDTIYGAVGQHTPYFVVVSTALAWTAVLLRFASAVEAPFIEGVGRYALSWAWEEER